MPHLLDTMQLTTGTTGMGEVVTVAAATAVEEEGATVVEVEEGVLEVEVEDEEEEASVMVVGTDIAKGGNVLGFHILSLFAALLARRHGDGGY